MGLHGEFMVLEGFARCQFVMRGRNTREFAGKSWSESGHNLDFIFERDGRAYGIEVKNTLGYMDYEEFQIKDSAMPCVGHTANIRCEDVAKDLDE